MGDVHNVQGGGIWMGVGCACRLAISVGPGPTMGYVTVVILDIDSTMELVLSISKITQPTQIHSAHNGLLADVSDVLNGHILMVMVYAQMLMLIVTHGTD